MLASNSSTAATFGQRQCDDLAILQGQLSGLLDVRNAYSRDLRSSLEALVEQSRESCSRDIGELESLASISEKQHASLERSIKRAMEDGTATEQSLRQIIERSQADAEARQQQRNQQFERMQRSILDNHAQRLTILDSVVQSLTGTIADAVQQARSREQAEANRRAQDHEAAEQLAKSQIARLEARNRKLEQFAKIQQAETATLRQSMLQMLDESERRQERALAQIQSDMAVDGEACVADAAALKEALRTEERNREAAEYAASLDVIEQNGHMQPAEEQALVQTAQEEQSMWSRCLQEVGEASEADRAAVAEVSQQLSAVASNGKSLFFYSCGGVMWADCMAPARSNVTGRIEEQRKKAAVVRNAGLEIGKAAKQHREDAANEVQTVSARLLDAVSKFY